MIGQEITLGKKVKYQYICNKSFCKIHEIHRSIQRRNRKFY